MTAAIMRPSAVASTRTDRWAFMNVSKEARRRIRVETGCGWLRAWGMVLIARDHASGRTHPQMTLPQMLIGHRLLCTIMADEAYPAPGSAHEGLNQLLLPAGRSFYHTRSDHLPGICLFHQRDDLGDRQV